MHRQIAEFATLGVLLAVGLSVGGYFVGHGLLEARSADRYVTVKGLSEREFPADLVLWPIVFTVTADDLETLQRRIDDGDDRYHGYRR
mgnify:CR=1 FL=1